MGKNGIFIAFEGLDGSGKTTQLCALKDKLQKRNIEFREEREPSNGILGIIARDAVKKKLSFSPHTMALLFAADRYEHVINDIKPYLDKGVHVISDRFILSNFAYQGITSSFEDLYCYNRQTIELLMPDVTIFIDVDPKVTLNRIDISRADKELYDEEGIAIRESFLAAIKKLEHISNVVTIDGNRSKEVISDEIWKIAEPLLMR